jgi:hypothetical protein
MVFLFTVTLQDGEMSQVKTECEEGSLHWVPIREVGSLNLWAGDLLFIDDVLSQRPLTGTIWYHDGKVERSWIQRLT